ncbi:MAG: ribonuclease HII [Pseudomonadota bacterium]|nr:ribonuclease HII [Pseudomonadota bacterium]
MNTSVGPGGSYLLSRNTAGIDEAGRGPLAGPVIAAAVVLDPEKPIDGLGDSKTLKHEVRVALKNDIHERSIRWALGCADVEEIDRLNILQATLLAMRRAVTNLGMSIEMALVDGNVDPGFSCPTRTIVRGDTKVAAISAASILAKVARDEVMVSASGKYPEYGFEKHKGYGTREHLIALKQYGPSQIHRKTFAPVRDLLVTNEATGGGR